MARKKHNINLNQPIKSKSGDLGQLFSSEDDAEQASGLQLLAIRIDHIQADINQPRKTFVDETLEELSESIRQDGVIQPIEVAEIRPGQYMIVHGERRWRAAKLAGLETIPAIVQRRDYNDVTRFVRQLVENMQREDLNDVDRAKSLVRLKKLMEEELARAKAENITSSEPWGKTVTWAKVGERLGYSRQRVSQLTNVLKLDDEIQQDIESGTVSERETRIYQGLTNSQMRALHREHQAGAISDAERKQIARTLKGNPSGRVASEIRRMRRNAEQAEAEKHERLVEQLLDAPPPHDDDALVIEDERPFLSRNAPQTEGAQHEASSLSRHIDNIKKLDIVRGHLSRIERRGLSEEERNELLRLLDLIQTDIESLKRALKTVAE